MENKKNYSIQEVADSHLFISKRELIIWLRRYNFIHGMRAALEFILMGYFIQQKEMVINGNFKAEVDILLITCKGISFLKKLHKVLNINIDNCIY